MLLRHRSDDEHALQLVRVHSCVASGAWLVKQRYLGWYGVAMKRPVLAVLRSFSWIPDIRAGYEGLVASELLAATDSQDCLDEDLFSQVQCDLETEFVQAHAGQLAHLASGDS